MRGGGGSLLAQDMPEEDRSLRMKVCLGGAMQRLGGHRNSQQFYRAPGCIPMQKRSPSWLRSCSAWLVPDHWQVLAGFL